jgi:hypothetical protein
MNSIFGDATTAAPTPATLAEAESLFSGHRSPVPPFSLGQEQPPEMDLQPPDVEIQNGKAVLSKDTASDREGVGGWISNLVKNNKAEGNSSGSGKYQRVGQEDDDQ